MCNYQVPHSYTHNDMIVNWGQKTTGDSVIYYLPFERIVKCYGEDF